MTSTATTAAPADRVWTVPNLLSLLRLLGVPLFLWLVLGPEANGWAIAVLAFGGLSDYADGKIARRFNQSSQLGALLDPAADRLYILATIMLGIIALSSNFDANGFATIFGVITFGYLVSRGIAKASRVLER